MGLIKYVIALNVYHFVIRKIAQITITYAKLRGYVHVAVLPHVQVTKFAMAQSAYRHVIHLQYVQLMVISAMKQRIYVIAMAIYVGRGNNVMVIVVEHQIISVLVIIVTTGNV